MLKANRLKAVGLDRVMETKPSQMNLVTTPITSIVSADSELFSALARRP